MGDPFLLFKQTHAFLTTRDQNRFKIIPVEESCADLDQIVLIDQFYTGSPASLMMIRGNDIKTLIKRKIVFLRIHTYSDRSIRYDLPDSIQKGFRHDPFAIIRNNNGTQFVPQRTDIGNHALGAVFINQLTAFPIKSHDLLAVGYDSCFQGCRAFCLHDNSSGINLPFPEFTDKLLTHLIGTDHTCHINLTSYGEYIVQYISRPAEHKIIGRNFNHGNRCLRRNPRNLSPDKVINHDITHHQNFRHGEAVNNFVSPFFIHYFLVIHF